MNTRKNRQLSAAGQFCCPVCNASSFSSERGLRIHIGRMHSTDSSGRPHREVFKSVHSSVDSEQRYKEFGFVSESYDTSLDSYTLMNDIGDELEDFNFSGSMTTANSLQSKETAEERNQREVKEIELLFRPGELQLAKFGMDHNLSQSTLKGIIDLGRSLSSVSHFDNMRNIQLIYRKLNIYYEKHFSGSVVNVFKISSPWLRKPVLFTYESPVDMVRSLIRESRVMEKDMLLCVDESCDEGGFETRSEMNTGKWWREIARVFEKDINNLNAILCPLIMYSDSTLVDKLMKRRVHPIILQIGIHSYKQRNLLATKRIIGFLPEVTKGNVVDVKHMSVLRRDVFHICWKIVMRDLKPGSVFAEQLRGEGELRNFLIFPSHFIADHPERMMLGSLRQSSSTNRPCPNCLITLKELIEDGPCQLGPRRGENEMESLRNVNEENVMKSYSLHTTSPFGLGYFPRHPKGLFAALAPCLMHTFARITLYVLRNVFEAVETYGFSTKVERVREARRERKPKETTNKKKVASESGVKLGKDGSFNLDFDEYSYETESDASSTLSFDEDDVKEPRTKSERIAEFEHRFSKVPYFTSNGRTSLVFRNNVTTLANFTAKEKKSVLFQLKYVLGTRAYTFLPDLMVPKVFKVLSAWCFVCKLVWMESGTKVFNKDFGRDYQEAYKDFIRHYKDVFTLEHHRIGRKILFHAAYHIPEYVEAFGNPKNFTSDSLEMSHGPLSKKVFQRTQGQEDSAKQILTTHRRYRAIIDIESKLQRSIADDDSLEKFESEFDASVSVKKKGRSSAIGKKGEIPAVVPVPRIIPLLLGLFRDILPKESEVDERSLQYRVRNSIQIPGIGKLTALEEFGKQNEERYPKVFMLPRNRSPDVTVSELRRWDIRHLCQKFSEEELLLGQIYLFIELCGTGNEAVDGKLCALYVHFEPVNKERLYHDEIEEPHIVYATDENNKGSRGRKLWWDIAFADDIICPVHVIPDFADENNRKAFIDTYPVTY